MLIEIHRNFCWFWGAPCCATSLCPWPPTWLTSLRKPLHHGPRGWRGCQCGIFGMHGFCLKNGMSVAVSHGIPKSAPYTLFYHVLSFSIRIHPDTISWWIGSRQFFSVHSPSLILPMRFFLCRSKPAPSATLTTLKWPTVKSRWKWMAWPSSTWLNGNINFLFNGDINQNDRDFIDFINKYRYDEMIQIVNTWLIVDSQRLLRALLRLELPWNVGSSLGAWWRVSSAQARKGRRGDWATWSCLRWFVDFPI